MDTGESLGRTALPQGSPLGRRHTDPRPLVTLQSALALSSRVVPDFDRVDDVLPQDVAAGSDGGHGTEVHVGYPNAEAGVLLE